MPTSVETGLMPVPDDSRIAWSREEVTAEAADLFRGQAARRTFRVLTLKGYDDGSAFVVKWEVPAPVLQWFLTERGDDDELTDEVLSVEAIDA